MGRVESKRGTWYTTVEKGICHICLWVSTCTVISMHSIPSLQMGVILLTVQSSILAAKYRSTSKRYQTCQS